MGKVAARGSLFPPAPTLDVPDGIAVRVHVHADEDRCERTVVDRARMLERANSPSRRRLGGSDR